ncbi:hypothetical protein RI129_012713 [Pyrocoelia pectoralis]|uniref:Mannosyltransferase n=1 Tax=Pyrocoelia pectoralis TaxID=417401 RepID=A0AAN7V2Z2_9COLE
MFLKELRQLPKSYLFCALLRIFLTCLPQTGYIHPDEYFQSIEALAEKLLNVKVNKPWEFNVKFPLRSIAPLYFTTGLGLQILKLLNAFLDHNFGISITTPYFIILFPRLLLTLLSFVVDWSLYRICLANSEKCKSRCVILSTSYIMLVYATHTFSNVIELILFSLLLYYVGESLIFSNVNVRQREYINKRYKSASTLAEKAKFHKLRLYLENDTLRNYFTIATIVTVGFFNRPTFAAYAIAPVFFWLYRGIGFKSIMSLQFHLRTIVFVVSTIPTVVLFVIVDSFFFGYLTWGEIGMLEISIDNFVMIPWNFFKYNINLVNLARHGLHSRFMNVIINIPLLFGVLAFLCYSNLADLLRSLWRCKYHYLPSVRSIRGLMTASIVFPVVLLSLIPHQEPRFLIPLIFPLVYLYGSSIYPEQVDVVMKQTKTKRSVRQGFSSLFKVWLVVNILLTVFYGFIHQGGVFGFVSHLSGEMRSIDNNLNYDVVTSHIYQIPHSLLYEESSEQQNPFKRAKRVTLHEKGSMDLMKVLKIIRTALYIRKTKMSHFGYRLFLVIPESLSDTLMYLLAQDQYADLSVVETVRFYPHLSTEALPDIFAIDFMSDPSASVIKLFKNFALTRFELQLNH